MNHIHITVAQSPANLNGPEERFLWLKNSLASGVVANTDLLLLPELFLTGYNVGNKVHEWSETADGPFAQKIAELCQTYKLCIHYGFAEIDNGRLYNAANCLGKDGKKLAGHRKLLLPPGFEKDYFSRGHHCELFSINNMTIGTLICYDAEFPENFRYLAQMGAEIILVPTALADQWEIVAQRVIPSRAFENGLYVCYANQSGTEADMDFLGQSCIVGPNGQDIERAEESTTFLKAVLYQNQVLAAQSRLPYLNDVCDLPWQ